MAPVKSVALITAHNTGNVFSLPYRRTTHGWEGCSSKPPSDRLDLEKVWHREPRGAHTIGMPLLLFTLSKLTMTYKLSQADGCQTDCSTSEKKSCLKQWWLQNETVGLSLCLIAFISLTWRLQQSNGWHKDMWTYTTGLQWYRFLFCTNCCFLPFASGNWAPPSLFSGAMLLGQGLWEVLQCWWSFSALWNGCGDFGLWPLGTCAV